MGLEITEGQELMNLGQGGVGQIVKATTVLGTQVVAMAASGTLNALTKAIRLHTDTTCRVNVGAAGVSAALGWRMVAGQTEYWGVNGGETVAVVTSA